MIKIGILGVDGSMGRLILGIALKDKDIQVISGYSIPNSPNIGIDVGLLVGQPPQKVKVQSVEKLEEDLGKEKPDIFIDFTIASATENNAEKIIAHGIPMVIATTGLSKEFQDKMKKISTEKKIPMVISTNMAIGVNILFKVAADLAKRLNGWDIEIIEAHHHRKADAPSGTALTFAENISKAIGVDINQVGKYGRSKGPNPRKYGKEEIGIHAVRAGDIVGDHIILYAGNGERIELKHQAHTRECFASGAIEAAKFLMKVKDKPKIYNMQEVLGLE
jgi:4-hydroxy-tetrahydrodipicolinate reductase